MQILLNNKHNRIKLTIEYDGSYFCGWQKQKHCVAVQEIVEQAINNLFNVQNNNELIEVFAAGRTDAGVHATGQVVHFDLTDQQLSRVLNDLQDLLDQNKISYKICRSLNHYLLGKHISVSQARLYRTDCGENFHARFDAIQKTYVYKIINRFSPLTFQKKYYWHLPFILNDIEQMNELVSVLIGTYDFSAFRSMYCQAKNPVRTLDEISVNFDTFNEQINIDFTLKARSFLHNQVRIMIGTIISIFRKKENLEQKKQILRNILNSKKRANAGITAPADGLYLVEVKYTNK